MDFTDDVVSSTIIFYFGRDDVRFSVSGTQDGTQEKSSQETPQEMPQKTPQKTPQKILELVKEDAYITTQRMADLIGIDRSNVARAIKKMQLQGILRRVGPDKGGYWEIISTDQQPTDEREAK